MFWIPICFLMFILWVASKLFNAALHFHIPDPDALNPEEERMKFRAAVADFDDRCGQRYDEKYSGKALQEAFWQAMGRQPTPEEEKAFAQWFGNKDAIMKNLLMSRERKLDTLFINERYYPTGDRLCRAIVEEAYLKIEDNLEKQGVHNVATVEHVSGASRYLYCLRDYVKTHGYGQTRFDDNFSFANVEYANPGIAMRFLIDKKKRQNEGEQS